MRLRWRSDSPAIAADRLADVLGLGLDAVQEPFEIDLGSAVLDFMALSPGAPGDERLEMTDDADDADGRANPANSADDPASHADDTARARRVVLAAVGLATVDADRFALEHGWRISPAPSDRVLGAAVFAVAGAPHLVVLEPDTEGRIAASLARWGEGPAAMYLWSGNLDVDRDAFAARGGRPTTVSTGPFGRAFGVGGGPAWGPHLVVVERNVPRVAAGTIGG